MVSIAVRDTAHTERSTTYMRRSSHELGNGLAGARITPTFAAPSSLARMWASAPPIRVNFKEVLSFASASAFKAMMEAMMSALATPMTSGASPCTAATSA